MPDEVNGQMMQILLSDYVADTAAFVFQKSGKIHAFLKDKVFSSAPGCSPPGRTTKRRTVTILSGPSSVVSHPSQHVQLGLYPFSFSFLFHLFFKTFFTRFIFLDLNSSQSSSLGCRKSIPTWRCGLRS
jgi:hypothetical protein